MTGKIIGYSIREEYLTKARPQQERLYRHLYLETVFPTLKLT